MAIDSVIFEDFKVIIWLGQTFTFSWAVAMVTVSSGTYVAMVTIIVL